MATANDDRVPLNTSCAVAPAEVMGVPSGAVGNPFNLGHDVRGQPDGRTLGFAFTEQVTELLEDRIETTGRLVEDEHLRSAHERQDEPDLAAVACAELAHGVIRGCGE